MIFNLYCLSKIYLKYVRTHFIVTKTEVSLVFSRPKPDTPKSCNTLDNNKQRIILPKCQYYLFYKQCAIHSMPIWNPPSFTAAIFFTFISYFSSLIPISVSRSHKILAILLKYFLRCCMNWITHVFTEQFLSALNMPDIFLGTGDRIMNKLYKVHYFK